MTIRQIINFLLESYKDIDKPIRVKNIRNNQLYDIIQIIDGAEKAEYMLYIDDKDFDIYV